MSLSTVLHERYKTKYIQTDDDDSDDEDEAAFHDDRPRKITMVLHLYLKSSTCSSKSPTISADSRQRRT